MQLSLLQSQAPTQPQSGWQVPTELPDLSRVPRFGGDSETNGLNVFTDQAIGVSLAWYDESGQVKTIYAPWGHIAGNLPFEKVRDWLKDTLRGKEVYFSNAKFDVAMFRNAGIDLEGIGAKPRDVAFNVALLEDNPRGGLGIDNLAKKYTDERKLEFPGNPDRMAEYPSWMAGLYAEQDAKLPLLVHDATVPLLRKEGLEELLALENDLIYFVCEIERNGCRIDVPKLDVWRDEVRKELEAVLLKIHKATGLLIQPGSGDDMRRLFNLLGLEPPPLPVWKCHVCKAKNEPMAMKCWRCDVRKRSGKPTYTEEQLLAFKHPVMNDVVQSRWLDGLLGRFLDKFWEGLRGDIIRSQYHQLKGDKYGTVSGRFSSTGGGHDNDWYTVNMQQNIKPKLQMKTLGDRWIVRELFIPEEGKEMWAADASQLEYRVFGHFANSEKIIKAYLEDENADFHQLVMDMILPVKPDIDRDTAKNTNFSRLYRAQAPTFAATAGISVREAERILQVYDTIFPEADAFSTEKENEARNRGYVTTILGRRARFGPNDRIYSAANRVVQGCIEGSGKIYVRGVGFVPLRNAPRNEIIPIWDGEDFGYGEVVYAGLKQKVVVKFTDGREIICSPDHKFQTLSCNNNKNWKTPLDFRTDDPNNSEWVILTDAVQDALGSVEIPDVPITTHWKAPQGVHNTKRLSFRSVKNDEDLGVVLGRLASDGSTQDGCCCWIVAEHEYSILPYLREKLSEIGKVRETVDKKEGCFTKKGEPYKQLTGLYIDSVLLSRQVFAMGLKKKIPDFVWANKSILRGFLRGLFDGDGGVTCGSIGFCSGQWHVPEYMREIQTALQLFGIRSRCRTYSDCAVVDITTKDNPIFCKEIGFLNERKQSLAEQAVAKLPRADTLLASVKSVVFTEEMVEMYDVVNMPREKFMCDGIIVHNSAADLFKLKLRTIYRERHNLGITALRQSVHDEQVADCDPDPKYRKLTEECFAEQEISLRVPITWSIGYGKNWYECK